MRATVRHTSMRPVQEFSQAERTAARVIDGSAYVVAIDRQMLLELNEVGTFIWERLDRPMTLDALARAIAAEFRVEPEAAKRDAEEFIRLLVDRGVVSVEVPEERRS